MTSRDNKLIQKKREKAIKISRLICILGLIFMFAILLALVYKISF